MTDEPAGPSVDVSVERVIHRPPEVVANYASEPDNAPQWYANIDSVAWKTPPPLTTGTQVEFVARFLGRTMRYTYEVAELTADSLIMRTAQGPFPMETSYRFESTPDGDTLMTLRNRGNPSGFSRLMGPFMRAAMRRANRKDLGALAELLEDDRQHD